MKLVIIQGATSTGKSTLACKLSKDLRIASFLKDDYKEQEFDLLEKIPSMAQWLRIEKDSWQAMYKAVAAAIKKDEPLIIEGNFLHSQRRQIKALFRPDTIAAEIFCYTKGKIMLKRFINRNKQNKRHKGHRDRVWYPLVAIEALGVGLRLRLIRPLHLSPNLLWVNTTDFAAVDYAAIRQFITDAR